MPVYNTRLTAALSEAINSVQSCCLNRRTGARQPLATCELCHGIVLQSIVSPLLSLRLSHLLARTFLLRSYYIPTNMTCDGGKNRPQAFICSRFLTGATSFSVGLFHFSGNGLRVGKGREAVCSRENHKAQAWSSCMFNPLQYKRTPTVF